MKTNMYTLIEGSSAASCFKATLIILFLIFTAGKISAQEVSAGKTIKGTVKFSEDNQPAPGVNIYLKGSTSQGTYSDENGQFEFPVTLKTGDILVFSFIGRKMTEYVVTTQRVGVIDVVMEPDPIEMAQEVLVEGDVHSRPSALARLFNRKKNSH